MKYALYAMVSKSYKMAISKFVEAV